MTDKTIPPGGFCTDCGATTESFDGLQRCPNCQSTGRPCGHSEQVNVSINWHELRILCIWAENWQGQHNLGRTVYSIAKRLKAQFPEHGPLTLAEELGELSKQYDISVSNLDLRRNIAEQTGEEVGLLRLPKPTDTEGAI